MSHHCGVESFDFQRGHAFRETFMNEQQALPTIFNVGTVYVPVTDQAKALSFYTDSLGFEKRFDFEYGGGQRWIEVSPPGCAHRVALVPRTEGSAPSGAHTYCALEVENAETARATLKSRGIRVSDIATQGSERKGLFADNAAVKDPVPPQFYLHDPDGNRFLVVQTPR